MIGDLAFLPIEVLLVSMIIHNMLASVEKEAILDKINMVIGAFFSEVGIKLLTYISDYDPSIEKIRKNFFISQDWSNEHFTRVGNFIDQYDYHLDLQRENLNHLKIALSNQRNFLLRLLENPNLLEHDSFTMLLKAVFHLTDELTNRDDLSKSPESDIVHLVGDVERVYVLLIHEWIDYMQHLKNNYPYMFSFAVRTNPFDQNATTIVK
jgi:hypothetical protein